MNTIALDNRVGMYSELSGAFSSCESLPIHQSTLTFEEMAAIDGMTFEELRDMMRNGAIIGAAMGAVGGAIMGIPGGPGGIALGAALGASGGLLAGALGGALAYHLKPDKPEACTCNPCTCCPK